MDSPSLPPETLEGWYALHQILIAPRGSSSASDERTCQPSHSDTQELAARLTFDADGGWSAAVELIGSRADFMVMHFRPTLESIGAAEREVKRFAADHEMAIDYSFLSVTEAGLYHLTAKLARDAAARGGATGDDLYREELSKRVAEERESAMVRRRLYPELPPEMPYVCFYPMSKRRDAGQNWYSLTLDERSQLMYSHGLIGRRYSGRVLQIIAGAIGFDAWEWGVTLFAKDPLDFKKLVTEMRFDEASARYAEFGDFYVGKLLETPRS